jgi:DNA-binding NarL/FixJ family response regulator
MPMVIAGKDPAGAQDRSAAVRVLVVDDQRVFRDVARQVIEATPPFELAGEASSGAEALSAVGELALDLVLLDVRMPGMDGIAVASCIRAFEAAPVVVLVSVEDRANVPLSLDSCGAAELVRKQDFGSSLLRRVWRDHGRA